MVIAVDADLLLHPLVVEFQDISCATHGVEHKLILKISDLGAERHQFGVKAVGPALEPACAGSGRSAPSSAAPSAPAGALSVTGVTRQLRSAAAVRAQALAVPPVPVRRTKRPSPAVLAAKSIRGPSMPPSPQR